MYDKHCSLAISSFVSSVHCINSILSIRETYRKKYIISLDVLIVKQDVNFITLNRYNSFPLSAFCLVSYIFYALIQIFPPEAVLFKQEHSFIILLHFFNNPLTRLEKCYIVVRGLLDNQLSNKQLYLKPLQPKHNLNKS